MIWGLRSRLEDGPEHHQPGRSRSWPVWRRSRREKAVPLRSCALPWRPRARPRRILAMAPRVANQWEKVIVLRLGRYRPRDPIFGSFRSDRVVMGRRSCRTTGFAAEKTLTSDTVPVNVGVILFWSVADREGLGGGLPGSGRLGRADRAGTLSARPIAKIIVAGVHRR